jgi:hypothetical protein
MRFDEGWLNLNVWLNHAAIASAVVIALSNVFLARVLFQVYHRADHVPAPRILVLVAGILALCGVSHLALLLDHATTLRAASVGLRLLAAGLWVAAAIRLPMVLDRLMHPRHACQSHDLDPSLSVAAAALGLVESELTLVNQRLRALECLIRRDGISVARDDETSHRLREALEDMEAKPCKI